MAAAALATSRPNYILTGIENWNNWFPDFKSDARANDTWSLFDGTEKIRPKPDEDQFRERLRAKLADYDAKYLSSVSMPEPSGPAVLHQFFVTLCVFANYYARCEHEYGYRRAFWEKQRDWGAQNARVRRANKMLYDRIHPSMRAAIEDVLDPAEAFRELELKFKTPDYLIVQLARGKINSLTLSECSNMAAYLNEMRQNAADLSRLGHGMTSKEYVTEIINGLSPAYDDWVEHCNEIASDARIPTLSVQAVEAQLIAREHILTQTLGTTNKGKGKGSFIE